MGRADDLFQRLTDGGQGAIDELIDAHASEELFLDFKRSANHGAGARLHNDDRRNFEKAISGFGNSEGGVLVWGVDCSRDDQIGDVANAKVPLQQPTRFKSLLEGASSGLTVPTHTTIEHRVIAGDQPDNGFVMTLIPKSNHAPHQTVSNKQYYMRAGSSFEPVPHAVLAGMFGRRPQADIFQMIERSAGMDMPNVDTGLIRLTFGIMVANGGPGIAESPFINLVIKSVPGPNCRIEAAGASDQWYNATSYTNVRSMILQDGRRLPPEAFATPVRINVQLLPPIEAPLRITGITGSVGSPTTRA